ncbi:MAG: enoyl-CoA hydratase-related protein [Actinomycetota bacterium]|nr:enoyl-CoA hydratase-related protein [Actinomycetota bacterium]
MSEEAAALVRYEVDGRVATITLDRPAALNAVSGAMADELNAAFCKAAADDGVWAVVLGAAGEKAFCVGADLKERAGFTLDDFHRNREQVRGMFEALRSVPQPVVASAFGFALGGGFELVLSCDLVVAAEGTTFGLPEARVGLLPAGGGTQLLTRKAGPSRAKELIFTGRRIDAAEAAGSGLVHRVVPRGSLAEATADLAAEICKSSPVAVRAAKAAIDAALGVPVEDGIEIEHHRWETVIASADRAEGIAAFNDKREPQWRNR